MKRNQWVVYTGLVLIFLVISALNILWLKLDSRPPMWDSALHLANALEFLHYFETSPFSLKGFLSLSPYYPPGFYMLLIPLLSAKIGLCTVAIVHIPFLLMLIFSTFYICKKLFANDYIALVSTFFTVTFPHIIWLSHEVMIDFEIIALISVLIALMVASRYFTDRIASISFGVVFGLGLLMKWTIVFYLAVPLLFMLFQALRNAGHLRKSSVNNFLSAITISTLIAFPWYLKNFTFLISHFIPYTQGLGKVEGDPALFSLQGLTYYIQALLSWQLFGFFFLIFVIAIFCAVIKKFNGLGLILSWILGPLVIFTFFANKAPRRLSPTLPAIAILCAWFIFTIKPKQLRRFLLIISVLVATVQCWMISFGISFIPENVAIYRYKEPSYAERSINCSLSTNDEKITYWYRGLYLYQQSAFGIWTSPKDENWQISSILSTAESDTQNPKHSFSLGLVPDSARINVWAFRATALYLDIKAIVWRIGYQNQIEKSFSSYQFILLKTGNQGPIWNTSKNKLLCSWVLSHPDIFSLTGRWKLPDSSEAMLFKNSLWDGTFPKKASSPWPF